MPDPISWLLIIICVILCAFFSASETALACCNRFKMQVYADDGNKSAKLVLKTCDKYDRALSTILIGNNIATIAVSSISTVLFLKYFNSLLPETSISILCSVIMALVVYIFGDTLPKTIAKAVPDTISLLFIYPLTVFNIIFYPIGFLFSSINKLVNKILKVKQEEEFSEEDFEDALEKANKDETIEDEQVELVQSAIEFEDKKVQEVLTPKEKIFSINIRGLTHEKLQSILEDSNYSRIPIYDKVFDNQIGILNLKIYFEEVTKDSHVDIRSILQKPYFINTNVKINDLFEGFKRKHTHIALIRDKHKHVIGMVTMEDILEELVSDISEPNSIKGSK